VKHKRAPIGLVAGLALVSGSWLVATGATADTVETVTLCHATNSNHNPYVPIEVDVSGDLNGHADHTGPVWNPTLKAQHIEWGDIIPPFDYGEGQHFDGLNWTTEGQAILNNECEIPDAPEQEFGSLAVSKNVTGLPLSGSPADGTVPTSFTAHVSCDDGTEQDVTFPVTGGAGTPALIDDIEAGSTCTVVEQDTGSFPTGTVVSYSPAGADSTGVLVDADATTAVTITNDFTGVQLQPAEEQPVEDPPIEVEHVAVARPSVVVGPTAPAPAGAVVARPSFTG
jgi:hypothetical protein